MPDPSSADRQPEAAYVPPTSAEMSSLVERFRTALSTRGENEVERPFLARWLGTRDAERVVDLASEVLTEVLDAN